MVADGFRIFTILFEGVLIDHLYLLPGSSVYDRLAVVIDDGVTEFHNADVDLIGKKMVPGILAFVKACFSGDFVVGGTQRSQGKSTPDEGDEFGIWFPAVDDVGFSIATGAEDDGFGAFEAAWRCATDGTVLGDVVLEPAFYIGAEVLQVAGVHPVDGGFEEASIETLGDGFIEGMDDVAAPAQVSFVVLGVIDFTGEAGEFPDENARFLCEV